MFFSPINDQNLSNERLFGKSLLVTQGTMELPGRKHITPFVFLPFVISCRNPGCFLLIHCEKTNRIPYFLSNREKIKVSLRCLEKKSQEFCCSEIMTVELKLNMSVFFYGTQTSSQFTIKICRVLTL